MVPLEAMKKIFFLHPLLSTGIVSCHDGTRRFITNYVALSLIVVRQDVLFVLLIFINHM